MGQEDIISLVRQELHLNIDEKTSESGSKFFKEAVMLHGVKTALVGKISKQYFKEIKDSSKEEIFSLCETLWQSGYLEESFIACNWSYYIHKEYEAADMLVFEQWLNQYVSNWASCDTFCNHSVGTLIEKFPSELPRLYQWAASANRWVRRGAAVSLIVPARKGMFRDEIFKIAELLLKDSDDLVQKGYGWLLKVASEADQERVFRFVMQHKQEMPRTALRYAIEKMPQELRKQAMAR